SHRRIGEVAVVGEPLEAAGGATDWRFAGNTRKRAAIRARAAAKRAGFVLRSIYGERPAGTERHDGADLPAANDRIEHTVHVFANRLAAADRHLVNRIG